MGLQKRRLVGNHRIRRRMGAVKAVFGKFCHGIKQGVGKFFIQLPRAFGASQRLFAPASTIFSSLRNDHKTAHPSV